MNFINNFQQELKINNIEQTVKTISSKMNVNNENLNERINILEQKIDEILKTLKEKE